MSWTCSVCGELHSEPLRDIRLSLPDAVFALGADERRERAEFGDDAGWLDAGDTVHYYVRGLLHLPIAGSGDEFRYGVWIEVDEPDYDRLGELWHEPDGAETRPFFGRLANDLEPYGPTLDLDVALQLRTVELLPAVVVVAADQPLGRAQRDGISVEAANHLAEAVLH